ncbi:hypothetical protein CCAN2_1360018 [Capnocytophaga canimorsus]|nr:hypothetical protein CCAN2_1360018 [Capnocytophaga canimorsus]
MKINLWYWFFGVFLLVSCQNVQKTTKANYQVVPLPEKIEKKEGNPFSLSKETVITYPSGDSVLEKTAHFLASYLKDQTGMTLSVAEENSQKNAIRLQTGLSSKNKEAYELSVEANGIVVKWSFASRCFLRRSNFEKIYSC